MNVGVQNNQMDASATVLYVGGMRLGWIGVLGIGMGCGPVVGTSGDTEADSAMGSSSGPTAGGEGTGSVDSTSGPSTSGPITTTEADSTSGDETSGSSGGSVTPPFEALCGGRGTFDLVVSGDGQGALEGVSVWVAAAEPESADGPNTDRDPIIARIATSIVGGVFEASCAAGLNENYVYPSIGVVADANGDGQCGAEDLGFTVQLFGWNRDQVYAVMGNALVDLGESEPWVVDDQAWRTVEEIGEVWGGTDVCNYYFSTEP